MFCENCKDTEVKREEWNIYVKKILLIHYFKVKYSLRIFIKELLY